MSNFTNRLKTALLVSLLCACYQNNWAQKAGLEVNRTNAVDRSLPLFNVAVDANGRKWAANKKGLFQVKAADFAVPKTIPAGQLNVLTFRGGNSDFSWSEAAFRNQVKAETNVTAAWYDEKTGTLWIGTDDAGLFQFKTDPELQLLEKFTPANSKLRSNNITVIFQDKSNRLWVGTDQGLMYGNPGRWKAELRGFDVQRIREYGNVIYALAAGSISKGVGGEKWSDLVLENNKIEGDITDFDIDQNGKMWIVSGLLTRYDLLGDTYETFSGPEYYTSEFGTHVAVDLEDAVWVGTSDKGLYHVDKASAITLNAYVDVPISCAGNGKDAVLVAKITGGTPPYTYSWSGGLSGENPKNVAPGTYSVTVADSKGKSRVAEVQVGDVRLRIKARPKKPVSAPGKNDGAAEVDIESNASGTQIRWDNGEMMATATQLSAGAHIVTVTDPKGCSATATVTVLEKALPLSVSITEKNKVNCAGEKTGSLALQLTGGKAPFRYAWNNSALSGDQPVNIPAGDYELTVTDAAGATAVAKTSVRQPEPLVATSSVSQPASTGNADGKATVQVKGGSGTYTYQWDNGESAASAIKLPPGQHRVTVTDANGCAAIAAVTVTEVGSSRVDLQACKLEYSIVSPK